jgi:hypothetical protein
LINIAVSDTIRRLLLVDTKSVVSVGRLSNRPQASVFVAGGAHLMTPKYSSHQVCRRRCTDSGSWFRRGEELHEARADTSVAPALEGAR